MELPAETNPQQGKRVRFEEKDSTKPHPLTWNASPLHLARATANTYLALLPSTIKKIGQRSFDAFIKLQTEMNAVADTLARVSQDGYIPQSARTKFGVTASKRVQEKKANELQKIVDQSNITLVVFTAAAREHVLSTIRLELTCIQEGKRTLLCRAFYGIAGTACCNFSERYENKGHQFVSS
jgi:hypothetical protein